ncbi:hypothetical protein PG985_003835 [Apiospora marii]|uniref:uncharacterized protein n=1 Tax=Apiospora marii TaxID=335849 RepID=UPI0031314829
MSAPQTFSPFERLPAEMQTKIWEKAIEDEHDDRVVPLTYRTGYVILTDRVKQASKFFHTCPGSREAALSMYDLEVPVMKNGKPATVRLSTKLDIFVISPWGFTMGINAAGDLLFQRSTSCLTLSSLAKMERIMEHRIALDGPDSPARPIFNRALFRSVKVCYLRIDHQKPTIQGLTSQIAGGPRAQMDLLINYTNPAMYRELVADDNFEETDQ